MNIYKRGININMQIIKYIILIIIFFLCTYIGILISKKYSNREKELKQMKTALNIFLTKVKLTYEPIPDIFNEISKKVDFNISNIFKDASKRMKYISAGDAWIESLDNSTTNMNKEDIEILKGLSNLMGVVNVEGQVSQIKLIDTFLDEQIENAQKEKEKNSKMYKTLGIIVGLAVVIVAI